MTTCTWVATPCSSPVKYPLGCRSMADRAPLRPPALCPGDTVRLVSPSGPTRPERVSRGIVLLAGGGLAVRGAPPLYPRHRVPSGPDLDRLAVLGDAAVGA